ncbi:MAG: MGMT family protein [Deinococcota bacterium]|nr:MGMT family protein [Deinococcota bacterium]
MSDKAFRERVVRVVRSVPPGRVATYGQIALLAGKPDAARLIGGILRAAGDEVPWQRVINREGGISTYKIGAGELQRALLEAEGVRFNEEGRCDLGVYGWDGALDGLE